MELFINRVSLSVTFAFILNFSTIGQANTGLNGQIDSLLIASSIIVTIDSGNLSGPGIGQFKKLLESAQFVSIAEEHEVADVNMFSSALFKYLNKNFGYNYLALEQGPILCQELNRLLTKKASENPVQDYAWDYKRSFHFAGDQELDFIQAAGKLSTAPNPLWGCNQEYGAEHVLALLETLAVGKSKDVVAELKAHAHGVEKNRKDNMPYMCCAKKPMEFYSLQNLTYTNTPLALRYIEALTTSDRIYSYYQNSSQNNPTIYENNDLREAYLKKEFLRNYTMATGQGDLKPKVMLKLGHWHLMHGLGPSGILTLGSLVSSLALLNGSTNLTIGIFINNKSDQFRGYSIGSLREYICKKLPDEKYILVNTIPLRKFLYSNRLKNEIPPELTDKFKELIYQYDMLLYIKDAKSVTWDLVYSNH